jgi:hypothetical protein
MKREPKWKRAVRIEREMSFELKAEAARIFPLLCPVREYDWIPDWSCEMRYSESGLAEKDAIFVTTIMPGKKATWCCVTYEPPELVEYVFVVSGGSVVRLSIRLEGVGDGRTRVTWAMRFTLSKLMARFTSKVTSREGFDAMIAGRKSQLEEYFAGAGLV